MEELRYQVDLLKALNQKLESDEQMYKLLCDTSSSAFLFFDFSKKQVITLGEWDNYFDFEVSSTKHLSLLLEAFEDSYELALRDVLFLEKIGGTQKEINCKKKNSGNYVEIRSYVKYHPDGSPDKKILRFKDVTQLMIQNEELKFMAYYDEGTGLFNRNHFIQVAGTMLQKAKDNNDVFSILFVDIDDFRKINDGFGMLVGDELIQIFGQFLSSLIKDDNVIISHFSSDIYCIAIYDPCGTRSVNALYEAIMQRCEEPFILTGNVQVSVSVCVGVAEFPEASDDLLKLIGFAEIVMFKAKKSGKKTIQYFDHLILQEFMQVVEVESKLKTAVQNQTFEMYFQPQFDAKSGKLRGAEALVRMHDENGNMISPAVFIPVAERNGTIVQIGRWVVNESLRIYAMLQEKYQIPFVLSINISSIQFKRFSFVEDLIRSLNTYNVAPECIELELTESIWVDDFHQINEKLNILRNYGIKISLDDFGTGYSSLSYLKSIPINTLKIDKSFVDSVLNDDVTMIILESIISLSQKLGFETVAEGVETAKQLSYLQDAGCDIIQGYLLGKPVPVDEFEKLLMNL